MKQQEKQPFGEKLWNAIKSPATGGIISAFVMAVTSPRVEDILKPGAGSKEMTGPSCRR